MILVEEDFARAIADRDETALANGFLALARWTIAHHVKHPATIDRSELVQTGVTYCLKALPSFTTGKKALPYFVEVVKRETRHVVRRHCLRTAGPLSEMMAARESAGQGDMDEMVSTIYASTAARWFPLVADALVAAIQAHTVSTVAEFIDSWFGQANRAEVREFLRQLRAEFKETA